MFQYGFIVFGSKLRKGHDPRRKPLTRTKVRDITSNEDTMRGTPFERSALSKLSCSLYSLENVDSIAFN